MSREDGIPKTPLIHPLKRQFGASSRSAKMNFPIKTIQDLEKISNEAKWQYFEKLVAFIFEENGFLAEQNVIINFPPKRQFDVIAEKFGIIFLVECKKWKGKNRNLKGAAAKHLERCAVYRADMEKEAKPLIVTLLHEDITEYHGVPVVPIMKLNWFLNNFDAIE